MNWINKLSFCRENYQRHILMYIRNHKSNLTSNVKQNKYGLNVSFEFTTDVLSAAFGKVK